MYFLWEPSKCNATSKFRSARRVGSRLQFHYHSNTNYTWNGSPVELVLLILISLRRERWLVFYVCSAPLLRSVLNYLRRYRHWTHKSRGFLVSYVIMCNIYENLQVVFYVAISELTSWPCTNVFYVRILTIPTHYSLAYGSRRLCVHKFFGRTACAVVKAIVKAKCVEKGIKLFDIRLWGKIN